MSTLQHTSQLRERATRRLVAIVVGATIAVAGIAAGIVAIASSRDSGTVGASGFVKAEMYASGALERGLPAAKAAQAASQSVGGGTVPTPQTPGHRP